MRSPCNFACRSTSQKRGQQKDKRFFASHNCFFPKPKMIAPKNFFLLKEHFQTREAAVAIISRPAQASRLFYCQLLRHCEHNNIHFSPIPLRFCQECVYWLSLGYLEGAGLPLQYFRSRPNWPKSFWLLVASNEKPRLSTPNLYTSAQPHY